MKNTIFLVCLLLGQGAFAAQSAQKASAKPDYSNIESSGAPASCIYAQHKADCGLGGGAECGSLTTASADPTRNGQSRTR